MMIFEPREDQLCIDIVTISGTMTRNDKADGKEEAKTTWIRKNTKKGSYI